MELRQLRYFIVIAELESFTAASVRLNVAQSALSRQIANLESELGVQLFDRIGRRARLSTAGTRLQAAAIKVMNDISALKGLVTDSENVGKVALGMHESDGDLILPTLFERLHEAYPGIQLDPVQAMTGELQEMLLVGRLHAAILTFPDALAGIDLQPLARERLYLLSARAHFEDVPDILTPAQAFAFPLIVPHEPSRERRAVEALALRQNCQLKVAIEADSLTLLRSFAQRGRGAAILPESAVIPLGDDPEWRISLVNGASFTRYLATRSASPIDGVLAIVLRFLFEEIDKLKTQGRLHDRDTA